MYSFNKVGKNVLLSNGSLSVLIPQADFSVVAGPGGGGLPPASTIIITVLNCKVSPSLIPYAIDEDGIGTITMNSSDVDFPSAASTALLVTKLDLLLGFEFPPQGGSTGDGYKKASNDDFDFELTP